MLDPDLKAACHEVGRLIVSTDTPHWLADYFVYWATPLASEWSVEQLQLSKKEMKEQLTRVVDAADALNRALSEPVLTAFLERTSGIVIAKKFAGLHDSLLSIRRYAYLAATSSALLDEAGKTKRGRGKTPVPGGLNPKVFCALIVAEAWKVVRDRYPGSRNRNAAKAALGFWTLSVGTADGWGDGLAGWRPHFEKAQNPEFAPARAKCLRILTAVKLSPGPEEPGI
jgi:hypothetical protein